MIKIKSDWEIEFMKKAGYIAAKTLQKAGEAVYPGITTEEIDRIVRQVIKEHDAKPSFLGYGGFTGAACVSVNEEVIHGIPGKKKIKDGDIVKLDVGAIYGGYHGDCAATFFAGNVSEKAKNLARVTKEAFFEGIKNARVGNRISDISSAVQTYAEKNGYSVVRKFIGHGVGSDLHEDPEVPNYGRPGRGPHLLPGMTIAVEPMINEGVCDVEVLSNGWTVVTKDGLLSAHYENTILITEGDPLILTQCL